jgi:hypothetical protein
MSEEAVARLHERIEYLLNRMDKLEVGMEKLMDAHQKIQIERAREHGYFAGVAALAALIGGIIVKFL